jgi:hypothetical protein
MLFQIVVFKILTTGNAISNPLIYLVSTRKHQMLAESDSIIRFKIGKEDEHLNILEQAWIVFEIHTVKMSNIYDNWVDLLNYDKQR